LALLLVFRETKKREFAVSIMGQQERESATLFFTIMEYGYSVGVELVPALFAGEKR